VLLYRSGSGDCTDVCLYDLLRYTNLAGQYKQEIQRRVYTPLLGTLSGKTVLDVACGTGRGAVDFAGKATRVVALDGSTDMLAVTRKKLIGRNDVMLIAGLAQALPFSRGAFDVVVALNFLHLFRPSTQCAFVDEMIRVLRPGGVLILEFDNALHGFGVGMARRWLGGERGSLMCEIRRVVSHGAQIVSVKGALIPYMWRVFCHFPRFATPLERLASLPFLSRLLCRRLYVQARKLYEL